MIEDDFEQKLMNRINEIMCLQDQLGEMKRGVLCNPILTNALDNKIHDLRISLSLFLEEETRKQTLIKQQS